LVHSHHVGIVVVQQAQKVLCNWDMTLKQSSAVHIQLYIRRTEFCRAVVLNFGF
jgi:hypothetical protein